MSSHNQIWIESDRKLFGSHRQRVLQLFLACLLSISSALGWPFPWFPPRQNEDVSEATPDRSFRMKMSEKSRSTTSRQKPWRGRRDKQKRAGKETASESADPHEPQDRLTLPTGENSESSGFIVMVYDASDSLSALARSCSTTPQAILSLNRLRYEDLRSGQVLRLPSPQVVETTSMLSKVLAPHEQLQREIWRGVRGKRAVALTFDAGGEANGARELLAYLRDAEVPATFFVTGMFVRRYPEIVREIAAQGHSIHNHSWSHPYFTKIEPTAIRKELIKADEWVTSVTGRSTRPYWRPPFGDRNRRVLQLAAECGFQSVYWTLDSLDSYGDHPSAESIAQRVLSPLRGRPPEEDFLDGAIILLHVGEPATVQALPTIVERLRQYGYRLVSLRELLEP